MKTRRTRILILAVPRHGLVGRLIEAVARRLPKTYVERRADAVFNGNREWRKVV